MNAHADTIDRTLLDEAAAIGASSAPAPGPGAPVQNYGEDALLLVEFVVTGICPLWPSLEAIYTPERRKAIAAPLGRVMKKYNLTLADLFAKWEPEISLAMVTVPLIPPTIDAIKHDRAKAKAAAELAKQAAAANEPGPM